MYRIAFRTRVAGLDGIRGAGTLLGKWSRCLLAFLRRRQEETMSLPHCGLGTRKRRTRPDAFTRSLHARRLARQPSSPFPGGAAVLTADEEPEIRVDKVMDIRRQLGEGRYSIADRIDVVIDPIVRDLG